MNDLQNSILEAMNTLAKSASGAVAADTTIQAVVVNVIDSARGLYLVEYLGNKFQASADAANTYSAGELVYVLVPQGDFSNQNNVTNKIILRAVSPTAKNYSNSYEAIEIYKTVGSDLIADDSIKFELNSYGGDAATESHKLSIASQISNHIKRGYLLQLEATIEANLPQQTYGNYGLKMRVPLQGGAYYEIVLDTSKIEGNPYALVGGIPQSAMYDLQSVKIDTSKPAELSAFVSGFAVDSEIETNDIFIKDINLFGVQITRSSQKVDDCQLYLSVSNGSLILTETDRVITPTLIVDGKETSLNGHDCYWFVEDGMITRDSAEYLPEGGVGWRCVNAIEDTIISGEETINFYNTNEYTYTLIYSDFEGVSSRRYKCVIDYNNILASQEVEITNNTASALFDFDLAVDGGNEQVQNSAHVLVGTFSNTTENFNKDNLVYLWQRFDRDGIFIENISVEYLAAEENEIRVKIPASKIDELNTIRCFVYSYSTTSGSMRLLATAATNLVVNKSGNYLLSITGNNKLYKYDSNGNSPLVADYDGPSPLKAIHPLVVNIFNPDGSKISDAEYGAIDIVWEWSEDSLFKVENAYVENGKNSFEGRSLVYTIADNFNSAVSAEKMTVTVSGIDFSISTEVNIQFIKEGESSVNGSKYTAILTYEGRPFNPYSTTKGENLTFIKTKGSWGKLTKDGIVAFARGVQLELQVYQNGEPIIDSSQYAVKWSFFGTPKSRSFVIDETTGIINRTTNAADSEHYIVQAEVAIGPETLFAYYPIDSVVINSNSAYSYGHFIPLITGGFSKVVYSSEGLNPKYDKTRPFDLYINEGELDFNLTSVSWKTSNSNLLKFDKRNKVTPIDSFKSDDTHIAIEATYSKGEWPADWDKPTKAPEHQPVEDYINSVNSDSFFLTVLFDYSSKIYSSIWKKEIKNCVSLLASRANCIIQCDYLLAKAQEIDMFFGGAESEQKLSVLAAKKALINFDNLQQVIEIKPYEMPKDAEGNYTDPSSIVLAKMELEEGITRFNNKYKTLYDYVTEKDEGKNELAAYNKIKDIKLPNSNITEPRALLIYSQFQQVVEGLPKQTNFNELEEYFETIMTLINNYGIVVKAAEGQPGYALNKELEDYFNKVKQAKEAEYQKELDLWEMYTDYQNLDNASVVVTRPVMFVCDRGSSQSVASYNGGRLYPSVTATIAEDEEPEYLTAIRAGFGSFGQPQTTLTQLKTRNASTAATGFSGVVLGEQVKSNTADQGIFGYYNGSQTFGLSAINGIAKFGIDGKAQIILDPSNDAAIIKSGNYSEENKSGMQIDLTTPKIQFGSGNFSVDADGMLHAKNVDIEGAISATSGDFGSFHLQDNIIKIKKADGTDYVFLGSDGSLKIEGEITASGGTFGNLAIRKDDTTGKPYVVIIDSESSTGDVTFVDAQGNVNIEFADETRLLAGLGSDLGHWYVREVDGHRVLQSADAVITLDPVLNQIYYKETSADDVLNATNINNGFYLGREGLTIPNAIQIKANANDKYWILNSSTLKHSSNDIEIGTEQIKFYNKFLINNEGISLNKNIKINSDNLISGKGLKLELTDGLTTTIVDSDFVLTAKNILLTDTSFKLNANVDYGYIECKYEAPNASLMNLKATTINAGVDIANPEIKISENSIVLKDSIAIMVGDKKLFSNQGSYLYGQDNNQIEVTDKINIVSEEINVGDAFILKPDESNKTVIDVKANVINIGSAETADLKLLGTGINIADNLIAIADKKVNIKGVTFTTETVENVDTLLVEVPGKIKATGPITIEDMLSAKAVTTESVSTIDFISTGASITLAGVEFTTAQLQELLNRLN